MIAGRNCCLLLLSILVNNFSIADGVKDFSFYFPAVKRSVASFGCKFTLIYCIFVVDIRNDNICRMSFLNGASVDSEDLCRVPAHLLDQLGNGQDSGFNQCCIRKSKACLNSYDTKAAFRMEPVFSGTACGAWSVLITLKEPSFRPAIRASTSFFVRSGGFIL